MDKTYRQFEDLRYGLEAIGRGIASAGGWIALGLAAVAIAIQV